MPDIAEQTDPLLSLLGEAMPVEAVPVDLAGKRAGLVVVDEVNGFATVGAGALAPPVPNDQVAHMVSETDRLARLFQSAGHPILAFLDTHEPGVPEPPYPAHCERGTGEEELVPALSWLETEAAATLVRKDCINGFIGATRSDGSNAVVDWARAAELDTILVVGICTDICVMDFVLTLLSARNHGMIPGFRDIVVHAPGCSTYDLPAPVAESLSLPPTARHPQMATHHLGLYFMASRGAVISDSISV